MNLAKTAEPIEMPFGMWGWVGPSNYVSDWGPDPPRGLGNLRVGKHGHARGRYIEQYDAVFYRITSISCLLLFLQIIKYM